jgi:hypothetical protein
LRTYSVLAVLILGVACSQSAAEWNKPGLLSPDGRAKARVAHGDGVTLVASQVFITLDRGRCGAGSVSSSDTRADIALSWRDSMTLEVSVPDTLHLDPAPASRTLGHRVQCHDHVVDVVVRRR